MFQASSSNNGGSSAAMACIATVSVDNQLVNVDDQLVIVDDPKLSNLKPIVLVNKGIPPKYDPKLNSLKPKVLIQNIRDPKLTTLTPVVCITKLPDIRIVGKKRGRPAKYNKSKAHKQNNINVDSDSSSVNSVEVERKRGRPGRRSIDANSHLKAVTKYNEKHPEVHRQAVKKYNESNPDIHRQASQKFSQSNPEVNRQAVQKYSQSNPEVNRQAVQKYSQSNPEVNKQAVDSALGVSHGFQHPTTGVSFLKIQGRVYHRVFDLAYSETTNPAGLYIYDNSERESLATNLNLDLTVIRSITHFLHNHNPYIECFKRLSQEPSDHAHLIFEHTTRRTHGNILGDMPLGNEIAAIISNEQERYIPRAIAIWKIGDKKPHTVDIMHPLYETFQYPLLYPHGNPGWFPNKTENNGAKLTQNKYVRCLLLSEPRFNDFNRLSEEWLVDMQCRILEERLRYLYNIQKGNTDNALRSAPLREVESVLQQISVDETIRGEGGVVPGRVYLPSSYTGGPRYMKQKYMDAMAVVNRLGLPSFLLTLTCNPKWPEIQNSTTGHHNTPSICARVFNIKLQQLLRDLRTGVWFGKIVYILYVIEFQKRGLPHAHICFAVEGGGPVHGTDVDKFIRADIPDASEVDGKLRKAVLDYMVHGPCGPPHRTDLKCWDSEKKKCTSYFPKPETEVTYCNDKGFINLKRNSKNTATIKYRGRDIEISDLWIVPYNAALLLRYDCHLNLESVSTRTVIKYLFKYMTKGPDEARVAIVPEELKNNEIEQYVTKRYIGSGEAAWRVFEFDVTGREPTVKMLDVHLENHQSIFFKAGNEARAVQNSGSDLVTYFNRPLGEEFDSLTYLDFYERYIVHSSPPSTKNTTIYNMTNGKFLTKRQRGEIVTRLFWVAPNRGEQFYLRLLLASHPCRSYRDLYNLGGPNCNTFQEAAKAVGIANDEAEYEIAMQEASCFLTGPRLRNFFVLLAVNGVAVATLWEKFKNELAEDILNRVNNDTDRAYTQALVQIDRLLRKHGSCLLEQGLPDAHDDTTELGREKALHDADGLREFVDVWTPKLSHDQRQVFE
ncbi:uncharacterized protein LOC123703676 [Colias croceus]|uniref:uncharacterized protein LOC123703676 n=1 Tax=Colias crocea TaxID=72248 RepID=UPI001E27FF6D|nr:uncharacterized protein LOC123703676 [Colias croceus]